MKNLLELLRPMVSDKVEASFIVDEGKVVYYQQGAEDSVEYSDNFYEILNNCYDPIVVHTHINDVPSPSLSDLVTWCSNEDIVRTAIISIACGSMSIRGFELNVEYIAPERVYDIWKLVWEDDVYNNTWIRNTILNLLHIDVINE